MKIAIINGPNLNLVGQREVDIYGNSSLNEYLIFLKEEYSEHSISIFQNNVEGEIINEIHRCKEMDAIIINAGAYTHTSIAIGDALKAIQPKRIVEVHISNVFARESYRHVSYISPVAQGIISGFGLQSYKLALLSLILGENERGTTHHVA